MDTADASFAAGTPPALDFLAAVEASDSAFLALDAEGRCVYVNAEAERLLGRLRQELIGRPLWDECPLLSGPLQRVAERALREGRTIAIEGGVAPGGARFYGRCTPHNPGVLFWLTPDASRSPAPDASLPASLGELGDQFHLLVEAVTDYAIFLLDAEGRIATWNTGAERIKGYRAAEVIGRHFSLFYPPERQEKTIRDELAEARDRGRYEEEGWRVRKDGTRFLAHVTITPVRDADGRLLGYAKVTHDITTRKVAEAERRQVRERLESVIAATPLAVIAIDLERRVTLWSPGAERMFGYTADEAIGQPLMTVPPEMAGDLEEEHASAVAGGGVHLLSTMRRRKDGSVFPASVWTAPLRDADGECVGVLGVLADDTERHEMETALRDALQRLTSHFENTPLAVLEWDRETRIVQWSPQAEAMFGWSADEVRGRRWTEIGFVHAEDLPAVERGVGALIRGESESRFRMLNRNLTKTGAVLYCEWHNSALYDEHGELVSVLSLAQDVTERVQTEIQRAQMLEKQSRIADTLQQSLLLVPPPDTFPGITVKPLYEAARDDALVGGDFYDVFAVAEDRVALVVGDVTGKGLEAAIYTAEVKFALRAFLREHPYPAIALQRLNHFVLDAQRYDSFLLGATYVVLAVALVDTRTGEVVCANAGIEPPFVVHTHDGEVVSLSAGGPILGAIEEAQYESQSETLSEGDLLVMFTDGITEARHGQRFFGYDGVVQAVREMAHLPSLSDIGKSVAQKTRNFADGRQTDDVCLLLARRT